MDALTEFVFPARGVRGAIVEIRGGIGDMLGWRDYAPAVRRLLTHAMVAMPLLASHSKFRGRMSLQFQARSEAPGPLKLLVAQIDRGLQVRGMAKADAAASGEFQALVAGGLLALLLEPEQGSNNYQAVVEVRGDSLAQSLEGYFQQSEQLPTLLRLAAGDERLAGVLLQRLPARNSEDDDAHWQHLSALFHTLGEAELADADPHTILHRLFHEEELRLAEPRPVKLACTCSHASISALLLSLGEQELGPVLKERGKVDVSCEFCGREYSFGEAELRELFAAQAQGLDGQTRH